MTLCRDTDAATRTDKHPSVAPNAMKDRSKNGTYLAIGGGVLATGRTLLATYAATAYGASALDVALILVQAAVAAALFTTGIWGLRVPEKRRDLGVWAIVAGVASLLSLNVPAAIFGIGGGALMRTAPRSLAERPHVPPGITP